MDLRKIEIDIPDFIKKSKNPDSIGMITSWTHVTRYVVFDEKKMQDLVSTLDAKRCRIYEKTIEPSEYEDIVKQVKAYMK